VVAVGSNTSYVVAKRLSGGQESYYYIDRAKDDLYKNQEEITQRPFSESEFISLKAKLQLPEFSKYFK
jgi:hypothetical protein